MRARVRDKARARVRAARVRVRVRARVNVGVRRGPGLAHRRQSLERLVALAIAIYFLPQQHVGQRLLQRRRAERAR